MEGLLNCFGTIDFFTELIGQLHQHLLGALGVGKRRCRAANNAVNRTWQFNRQIAGYCRNRKRNLDSILHAIDFYAFQHMLELLAPRSFMNQGDKVVTAKMTKQFIFQKETFHLLGIPDDDLIAFPLTEALIDQAETFQVKVVRHKAFNRPHDILLANFPQVAIGVRQACQHLGQCALFRFFRKIGFAEMKIRNTKQRLEVLLCRIIKGSSRHRISSKRHCAVFFCRIGSGTFMIPVKSIFRGKQNKPL